MHTSQVAWHAMHATARFCTSKSGGPIYDQLTGEYGAVTFEAFINLLVSPFFDC